MIITTWITHAPFWWTQLALTLGFNAWSILVSKVSGSKCWINEDDLRCLVIECAGWWWDGVGVNAFALLLLLLLRVEEEGEVELPILLPLLWEGSGVGIGVESFSSAIDVGVEAEADVEEDDENGGSDGAVTVILSGVKCSIFEFGETSVIIN